MVDGAGVRRPDGLRDDPLLPVFCPTEQSDSGKSKLLKRFNPISTVHGVVFHFLSGGSALTKSDGFRFAYRHPGGSPLRRASKGDGPLHPLGRSCFEALHATRCVAWFALRMTGLDDDESLARPRALLLPDEMDGAVAARGMRGEVL